MTKTWLVFAAEGASAYLLPPFPFGGVSICTPAGPTLKNTVFSQPAAIQVYTAYIYRGVHIKIQKQNQRYSQIFGIAG